MSDLYKFVPIRFIIPGWPTNILAIPSQIDLIGLSNFESSAVGSTTLVASGTLQIVKDIESDLPLVPGLSVVLLNNGDFTEVDFEIEFLSDWFCVTLKSLSAGIRLQTDLLKRMEATADGFVEAPPDPDTGEPQPVELLIEGADLAVNSEGQFTFTFADGAPALTIQPFMIADTGVIVDIQLPTLILSAEAAESLPEAIDPTWRGVYLEQATIHLPEGLNRILPDDVRLEDFFIGSGGFCGKVTGNWTSDVDPKDPFDEESGDIFGFKFRLASIGLEFIQNALVSGSIAGYLQVPFFDAALDVGVGLTNDGDFTVSLGSDTGLLTLEKPGVISIEVAKNLEFAQEDGASRGTPQVA